MISINNRLITISNDENFLKERKNQKALIKEVKEFKYNAGNEKT